jgi:hypothetical protein
VFYLYLPLLLSSSIDNIFKRGERSAISFLILANGINRIIPAAPHKISAIIIDYNQCINFLNGGLRQKGILHMLGLELKRPKQHLMDTISGECYQDTATGKREDIMMPMWE